MFNNALIYCVHISVEAAVNKSVYPLANMPVHLLPLRWHKTIWTRTRERNKKSMHQYLWSSDQCVSNTEPKASKVCSEKSYNYYLIFIRSERKKFAQRRWATVKRKERGGVGAFPTSYPSPLLLILNQARVGRIDDREFVTLTQTYGDRAFSVAAPKLWNELPLDLRSLDTINLLKKHLKTDLFKKAYNI